MYHLALFSCHLQETFLFPSPLFNKPSLEGSTPAFSKQFQVTFIRGKCKISVSQPLKIKQQTPSKKQNKLQLCSLSKWPVGLCVSFSSVNALFRGMRAGRGCSAWGRCHCCPGCVVPVGSTLGCRDVGKAVVRAGKAMGEPKAVQAGVYPLCFGKVCFCVNVQKSASMEWIFPDCQRSLQIWAFS